MAAIFHLICGSTGAGKTTYALRLAREAGAMHFSIDDWMVRLFGPDKPPSPQWPWIAERIARCEELIADQATMLGRQGMSSILDLSFLRAERRTTFAWRAAEAGLGVRLHLIDVAPEERWRRVSDRNAARGETYRMTVTRPMFDFIESIWQPPDTAELAALNGVRIT